MIFIPVFPENLDIVAALSPKLFRSIEMLSPDTQMYLVLESQQEAKLVDQLQFDRMKKIINMNHVTRTFHFA